MNREQIEKAADIYAIDMEAKRLEVYPDTVREQLLVEYDSDDLADAFQSGANWRINFVWHDAKEKPEDDRAYLAEYMDGKFIVFYTNIEFETMAKAYKVKRWAYIGDLLPERKEDVE